MNAGRRPRLLAVSLVLGAAGVALSGCTEVETEASHGYEPSKLEEIKGSEDLKRITFTREGAQRVRLETAQVESKGGQRVVPYAALIYDPEGKTYVYVSPEPRTFLREAVKVDRIDGDRMLLSDGPPTGTEVVTVGVAEVYGTELEIASK